MAGKGGKVEVMEGVEEIGGVSAEGIGGEGAKKGRLREGGLRGRGGCVEWVVRKGLGVTWGALEEFVEEEDGRCGGIAVGLRGNGP